MSWGSVGAILIVLVVLAVLGKIWFHSVEAILSLFKKLVFRKKAPPAWHPLPEENEKSNNELLK